MTILIIVMGIIALGSIIACTILEHKRLKRWQDDINEELNFLVQEVKRAKIVATTIGNWNPREKRFDEWVRAICMRNHVLETQLENNKESDGQAN